MKKSQYLGMITLVFLVVGGIVTFVEAVTLTWPVWGPTIAMGFFLGVPISEKIVHGSDLEWSLMLTDILVYLLIYIAYLLLINIAIPAMF